MAFSECDKAHSDSLFLELLTIFEVLCRLACDQDSSYSTVVQLRYIRISCRQNSFVEGHSMKNDDDVVANQRTEKTFHLIREILLLAV